MIGLGLFVLFVVNGVSSEQYRIIGEPPNGEKIPLDISVKDGYMMTVSGQPYPPQPFFVQSVNLYDFDMHLSVRKVVEEDVCYIKTFTATREQMKQVIDSAKETKITRQVTEVWNIPGAEIRAEVLGETVGEKIAEFCSEYRVFWVKVDKQVTRRHVRMAKRDLSDLRRDLQVPDDQWVERENYRVWRYDNGQGLTMNAAAGEKDGGWSAAFEFNWEFP